jgi:hypothetical protein
MHIIRVVANRSPAILGPRLPDENKLIPLK